MGKMLFRSRWLRSHALLLLVAVALGSLGDRTLAVQGGKKVLFGPLGVARQEAVRVNVYAAGNPDGISDPNDVPWDFVVRIFNRRGDLADEQRLRLAPGVTASVEVNIGNPDIFPVERLGRRTLDWGAERCAPRLSASTRNLIRQAPMPQPWRSTTFRREAPASCLVVPTLCRPPHNEGEIIHTGGCMSTDLNLLDHLDFTGRRHPDARQDAGPLSSRDGPGNRQGNYPQGTGQSTKRRQE
jgi:hypothetical protein